MGIATIDPHSLKEPTEIQKIPKFGVNRPNSESKFLKQMYGLPDSCPAASSRPHSSF